jgi:hypothetical protein
VSAGLRTGSSTEQVCTDVPLLSMILRCKILLLEKSDPARLSFTVLETKQPGQGGGICGSAPTYSEYPIMSIRSALDRVLLYKLLYAAGPRTCDSKHPSPLLLVSVLMMNCSPGRRHPRMGATHSNSFRAWEAASASGDNWKVCLSCVSRISGFAMS